MFRKLKRKIFPNPFDLLLKKARKKGQKKFLLAWNRGLGDIPLGLYALKTRILEYIPEAEITFIIRENLKEGFSLFEGVKTIIAPDWKRNKEFNLKQTLEKLNINENSFDVIVEKPDPAYWTKWQIGKLIPKLKWQSEYDELYKRFNLDPNCKYIGVQVDTETGYALWRSWPKIRWQELFAQIRMKKDHKVILFGLKNDDNFPLSEDLIDLRGKTSLLEMLSIIKNRCSHMVLPDGGILSILYYLDTDFALKVVSLWNDRQGVLKQNVASSNKLLKHIPLFTEKDLSAIQADQVYMHLFSSKEQT